MVLRSGRAGKKKGTGRKASSNSPGARSQSPPNVINRASSPIDHDVTRSELQAMPGDNLVTLRNRKTLLKQMDKLPPSRSYSESSISTLAPSEEDQPMMSKGKAARKRAPLPAPKKQSSCCSQQPMEFGDDFDDSQWDSPRRNPSSTSSALSSTLRSSWSRLQSYSDSFGSSVRGDRKNIGLLMVLYVLQGIPLGLSGSIPFLLQSRHVSYKDQALFSFVYWPFSIKLLWAPIVDSVFMKSFGRRKSWLVPTQYLLGIFMMILSFRINYLMGETRESEGRVNITTLTVTFFVLNFLAATQDIAVDGWALTMLHRANVGWASTCNSVGQTAGYFLGNVVFLALESPDFCNAYLRSEYQPDGLVTLSGFLFFWGIIFMLTTTAVMIMKKETSRFTQQALAAGMSASDPRIAEEEPDQSVVSMYKILWNILKLHSIQSLILILLTSKIGFAAADAVTGFKLIEEGVPKEKLALLGIPMVPLQILLPFVISRYTAGPRPMDVFLKAMPLRLCMGLVFMGVVKIAPLFKYGGGQFSYLFYAIILLTYAMHQATLYSMFVAQMAFFAKISDPLIGGTYMTLLNTLTNFGGNWPSTVVLWMVENLTWKECQGGDNYCENVEAERQCTAAGGTCVTKLDGYYLESVICFVIGVLWFLWKSNTVRRLQTLNERSWMVDAPNVTR